MSEKIDKNTLIKELETDRKTLKTSILSDPNLEGLAWAFVQLIDDTYDHIINLVNKQVVVDDVKLL